MEDLNKLSNEELEQIVNGGLRQKSIQDEKPLSQMSDAELEHIAMGGLRKPLPILENKGFWEGALDSAIKVGQKIDSVTGAPTRAAIGALQDGNEPFSAFYKQFAENPELAPSGKTLVEKAGVPKTALSEVVPDLYSNTGDEWLKFKRGGVLDPTASGAAGLGVDLAADWTNLAGAGLIKGAAKMAGKGAEMAAEIGAKTAAKSADILTGTKAGTKTLEAGEKAIESVGNMADSIKKVVTPKISDDYGKMLDVAKRNGIDPSLLPEAVEFGPNSFIARSTRNLAEGPLGQAKLEKFYNGLDSVRGAIDKNIEGIAGGHVLDEIAAGGALRHGFDQGVDTFFKGIDLTHNSIMQQVPGLMISEKGIQKIESSLNGIEKFAKGRELRGITGTQREQAKQLLAAVNAVREGNGSYKQTVEALREIGDVAFKAKNSLADIPPDIEKLRKLYFDIDEALIDTVKTNLGDDIAESLVKNNKAMSEFFGDKGVLAPIVGAKNLSDEKVFQSLILNGDSKKIEALKKILPPEQIQQLKGAFLESLIRRNSDGTYPFRSLQNAFRNKGTQIKSLFQPEELRNISELLDLGEAFGSPVLSSSGTGASNFFRSIGEGVRDSVINESVVDKMKSIARGAGEVPPASSILKSTDGAEKALNAVENTAKQSTNFSEMLPDFKSRYRVGAKGAQALSTLESNAAPSDKIVEMADANPDFINSIKNPNLKRQLIEEVQKRREKREMGTFKELITPRTSEAPENSFIEGN